MSIKICIGLCGLLFLKSWVCLGTSRQQRIDEFEKSLYETCSPSSNNEEPEFFEDVEIPQERYEGKKFGYSKSVGLWGYLTEDNKKTKVLPGNYFEELKKLYEKVASLSDDSQQDRNNVPLLVTNPQAWEYVIVDCRGEKAKENLENFAGSHWPIQRICFQIESAKDLNLLLKFPHLKHLAIIPPKLLNLSVANLSVLSKIKTLESLTLGNASALKGNHIEDFLGKTPKLKGLHLKETSLSPASKKKIEKKHPKVTLTLNTKASVDGEEKKEDSSNLASNYEMIPDKDPEEIIENEIIPYYGYIRETLNYIVGALIWSKEKGEKK